MSDVCYCGHVRDEHERTFLAPCAITAAESQDGEDCRCAAFDAEPEAEDDDE